MLIYIGIDNTDSKESRGTGFRSRQMASQLELAGCGKVLGITRHQLLVMPDQPRYAQNAANCLEVDADNPDKLFSYCRDFLIKESQPDSCVGLCLALKEQIADDIFNWGQAAKTEILKVEKAFETANLAGIRLEGLTGDGDGVIGALAAVGLRSGGNDGRFIWQPGKQLKNLEGTMTVYDILYGTKVDHVMSLDGKLLEPEENVDLSDWVRAVLINSKVYILVDKNLKKSGSQWRSAEKIYIKDLSS